MDFAQKRTAGSFRTQRIRAVERKTAGSVRAGSRKRVLHLPADVRPEEIGEKIERASHDAPDPFAESRSKTDACAPPVALLTPKTGPFKQYSANATKS